MKVLFAVNNESISDSIIKKYQQEYKEIISSKNVYYFNAISKELQKDKSYDRIVISEDLEPFANNNYEIIDKFIFEKLDSISDEATSSNGQDIPIILICADRRTKSEPLLTKLFGIGIYSALLGQDRSITKVCELINQPRTKKDAKLYYRIDSEDVDYKVEGEGDVSEVEIQNILNHYKRLGKNEDKYVESFDSIAAQYTDPQLRVICKFLPLNVKAVLEANSQKYQELITFGTVTPSISEKERNKWQKEKYVPNSDYKKKSDSAQKTGKIDIIEKNIGKSNLSKPVIIPSAMNISNVRKVKKVDNIQNNVEQKQSDNINSVSASTTQNIQNNFVQQENQKYVEKELENNSINAEPKVEVVNNNEVSNKPNIDTPVVEQKRRRGRPKKVQTQEEIKQIEEAPKKKRGRPRKVQIQQEEETDNNVLPGFDEQDSNSVLPGFEDVKEENDNVLPGFDDQEKEEVNLFDLGNKEETRKSNISGEIILPGFDENESQDEPEPVQQVPVQNINQMQTQTQSYTSPEPSFDNFNNKKEIENTTRYNDINLDSLLTGNKKIVSFVGTSKNGTSFLVNNLAEVLSKKGIKTAVLDLTKNKNAYYIYTQNEEELRKKAFSCITNLKNGIVDGIQVNNNLTVFTTLPDEDNVMDDYESILTTLAQNYSLILMDCDFDTNYGYFKNAQEIYLVQSFDILTIQPLTAFLRNLKTKNILDPEKLRIVLNKVLRVRSVTERAVIGGMAFYNDPAMSFMTELFNKDTIKYCTIPFEEQTYSRYLEGLVNCKISVNGYSKNFMMSLEKLSNMVYPLLSNSGGYNSYNQNGFSNNMNATLNKMKRNY